jgi:hypothetical protein
MPLAGESACPTTGMSFVCIGGTGFSLSLEFLHFPAELF